MTREELIERICPTDATVECEMGDCYCDNCKEVLNAFLDEYDKQIREETIKLMQEKTGHNFEVAQNVVYYSNKLKEK